MEQRNSKLKKINQGVKKKTIRPINSVESLISRKKGDAVMRIDAYNQIAKVYGVQQSAKTQKTQKAYSGSDQLSISQAGRDYQIAKNAVSEASDIREDKVAQLKQMVDSGTYEVTAEDFASKLLEKYNSIM